MVKQASLASDLASIVGRENAAPGTPEYAVDGLAPKSVVRPRTPDEVASVISYANANRLAVIPLGGRLHAGLGNLPERYDLALDVSRLNQIVESEPADLTITCQAGITLGALRQTTGAAGMVVPFDPALPDGGTVGGVLASALTGPARMSLGAPRDFTIGLRVVTADGRLTRAGGKVVKNVAGYDLCKLYIGSLGSLGVIVEATFKTVPLPKSERRLAFEFNDPASACALVSRAVHAGLAVRSASLVREAGRWRLYPSLAGMAAAVERSVRDLDKWSGQEAFPTPAGAGEGPGVGVPAPLIAKLSVLPNRLSALVAEAPTHAGIQAHPATGLCRLSFPEAMAEAIAEVRTLAARFGGTCIIERCPPDLKRGIDVFGDAPPSLALMRAVKAEFDPNRVLSPGRFVGRL
ncbi:MAG: FAD-binding oxidoreductase [Chloroflexota bacterium]|nr:FAD-binding oxidoreductase [Chloroflexota bacterium]